MSWCIECTTAFCKNYKKIQIKANRLKILTLATAQAAKSVDNAKEWKRKLKYPLLHVKKHERRCHVQTPSFLTAVFPSEGHLAGETVFCVENKQSVRHSANSLLFLTSGARNWSRWLSRVICCSLAFVWCESLFVLHLSRVVTSNRLAYLPFGMKFARFETSLLAGLCSDFFIRPTRRSLTLPPFVYLQAFNLFPTRSRPSARYFLCTSSVTDLF